MSSTVEPIAIIGVSFKLPQGAEDERSLWDILENARNVMTPWPESRANLSAHYKPDTNLKNVLSSKGGHFFNDDVTAFDAPFFSITSEEASSMDPQQRWLLETSYRALENSGIPVESVAGSDTAVFSASMSDDYMRILVKDPDEAPTNITTGTCSAMLANRLSWYFDLKGPSIEINTACSSSMIAVDLACQSLQAGQTSMALVTGSNVLLSPEISAYMSNMNLLSPDSLCYSFDHRANGYARGEGVVVVVLKRLHDAIKAGDMIRAVIRATGSNQDGHTPGITQPSLSSQEELIRKVYKSCGLGFESTRYIEAHGTGTKIGDFTEAQAIGRVFRSCRSPTEPLYIGSVKANIGHTEGASGLTGILKCILILEKGVIPPNALFEKLNPKINAKTNRFQIPTSCIRWPTDGLRRVSINSFGFGGSNGHIIMDDAFHTLKALGLRGRHATVANVELSILPGLTVMGEANGITRANHTQTQGSSAYGLPNGDYAATEAVSGSSVNGLLNGVHSTTEEVSGNFTQNTTGNVATKPQKVASEYRLLVWSAKDEPALRRMIDQYNQYYETQPGRHEGCLSQLAYTLAARRSVMTWRSFAVVSREDSHAGKGFSEAKFARIPRERGLGFVFTGQGAQYATMGLDLLRYPVFQTALTLANNHLHSLGAKWSLFEELLCEESIHRPEISQPLCTALQIGLIELFRSFGIIPKVVVGHSSGEIAAAYTLGALSLESACKIAYHRGKLAQSLVESTQSPYAMMSVNLPESAIDGYVEKASPQLKVSIACVNSPFNVTLSGEKSHLDMLKERLDKDEIFSQQLKTGVAYHSPMMQQIASEYLSLLGTLDRPELDPEDASVMMVSSVTGQRVSTNTLSNSQYWVDNLVSAVRFSDALEYIAVAAPKVDKLEATTDYIEIGPHGALRRPLKDTLKESGLVKTFRYSSSLSRFEPPAKTILDLVGKLFLHGYPVSITAANAPDSYLHDAGFLVDTPQYPFDHSNSYWHESRFSKEWRLREDVPRNLLGTRAMDWNPLEPRWRKQLSIDNTPWIADHAVGGNFFFPATGTIMMALGAVKEMSDTHQVLRAYNIKECTFMNPIVVRPESKVEVTIHLHPLRKSYEKATTRFDVQIFAITNEYWTECFKATCHIEYEDSSTEVDCGYEFRTAAATFAHDYEQVKDTSTKHISRADFYQWHSRQGLEYGKAFSITKEICWDGNHAAIGTVETDSADMKYEGIVHPAVLDAAFQIGFTGPSRGMSKALPTFIPHRMVDTWISAEGWKYPSTSRIRTLAISELKGRESRIEGALTVLSDDGSLLCHVRNFEMLPIMSNESKSGASTKRMYTIDWKPHLPLLTSHQLQGVCGTDEYATDGSDTAHYSMRLERSLRLALRLGLDRIQEFDFSKSPPHMSKYVSLMQRFCQRQPLSPIQDSQGENLNQDLEELKKERPTWRLFIEVAQSFLSLVNGSKSVDSLMPAAQEFIEELQGHMGDHRLVSYLELLSHQTPNQKILEFGAGSGALTTTILSALQQIEDRTGGIAFSEYTFTDTTSDYFENAQQRFSAYKGRMNFKVADVSEDLTGQGIPAGAYDMVVVSKPLHISKSLASTFQNIRQILKPGGQLIFYEHTLTDSFNMSFAFGVFPTWWNSEEKNRFWCPTTEESGWDTLLRANGFSGSDLAIKDYGNDAAHYASIIISTSQDSRDPAESRRALLVMDNEIDYPYLKDIVATLEDEFHQSATYAPRVLSLNQLAHEKLEPSDFMVYFADSNKSKLSEITETRFELIKAALQQSKNVFWISFWAHNERVDSSDSFCPYDGIADGLLRTLRSEFSDKRVVSLSLDSTGHDTIACVNTISRVFHYAFGHKSVDVEYVSRDGIVLTGRLVEEAAIGRETTSSVSPEVVTETWLPGPPLKLDIGSRGQLETLCYNEDFDSYADLGPTEVEIETKAWAVNFRDMFYALGRLEEGEFGSDCAGIVTRVGSECRSVQPGDRVAMAVFGCMRTYARNEEWAVVPISDSVPFEEACAVMNPGYTAWQCLIEVARLKRGETILIHAASGATGQLAIQIAQMVGAEVFATVGYEKKKQLLMDLYNIPADHIFYSRNLSFAKGISRVTDGRGVDVVLNSLFGEGLIASWECVASNGRFIEIGKADIDANSSLPMKHFVNNVTFAAVDLRQIVLHNKDVARDLLHKTMKLAAAGSIHYPKPLRIYDANAIEEAFRYFQSGKNSGRIVIRVSPAVKVQKHLCRHMDWAFDATATYVIAGGFGGIGRSILRWMALKGAKHVLVLSRSGAVTEAAAEIVNELSSQNVVVVAPKCDVSSLDSLSAALEECAKAMPPIRGCINATMVLHDAIFEKMTHVQWECTIRSKVQSSWNLHTLLPRLEFFILLSSVSGIVGNPGQSNYAAGCTFQDALARHRTRRGQKAISIDLGAMRTVGVVAESEFLKKRFEDSQGFAQVEEHEFFSLLDQCCNPGCPTKTSQIALGLVTPADLLAHSAEPLEAMRLPLYAYFSHARDAALNSSATATVSPGDIFKRLETEQECTDLVVLSLARKLARALSIQPEDIDTDQPLHAFGVDSLVAVELRNWIAREFAADVAVFEIMGGRTVTAIGELVTKTSQMKLSWKQG